MGEKIGEPVKAFLEAVFKSHVSTRAGTQPDDAQFQPTVHFVRHPGCHMNWHVCAKYLVNLLNTLEQTAGCEFWAGAEIDYHAFHRF
ncbi:MAG: hypothetical protein EOM80_17960, partial [Erysipelotrichia bacterium]|nr:hypothetical protein [Erysipelotrichia bacterium]